MRTLLTTITTAVLGMILTTAALADDHSGPRTSALEAYFCNFVDGKDMGDLEKVAAGWDEWADSNFTETYTAYILSPALINGADFPFDSLWLGVAENHEAMGKIGDDWSTKGGQWQKKFDAVSTCSSHALMSSVEARPYDKLEQPGYVQISACQFKQDASFAELTAADKEWSAWMDENAMPGGIYRWIPGIGAARADKTDYYSVYTVETLAGRGKAHDMMMAGGFQVWNSLYSAISDCDNPRVWAAQPAGGVAAQ